MRRLQDLSIAHDVHAQEAQEVHAHETRSFTRDISISKLLIQKDDLIVLLVMHSTYPVA